MVILAPCWGYARKAKAPEGTKQFPLSKSQNSFSVRRLLLENERKKQDVH
jgi:hypothetical protein